MNDFFVLVMAVPLVIIIGGLIMGAMALNHQARLKELAYRERIAMIERGMVPAPEADPKQFERTMSRLTAIQEVGISQASTPTRYRSAGVVLIAIGLGCMMIISFAGEAPGAGVGVGGAIMVLGAALLLNAYMTQNDRPLSVPPPREPAPPQPPVDTQGPTL